MLRRTLPLLLLALAAGCRPSAEGRGRAEGAPLRIVATTGMVADAAAAVAGELGTVEALMGPGVDPHYYKASQGDVGRLRGADAVVHNGLHLEGRMQEVLEALGREKPVVALADGLPAERLRRVGSAGDAAVHDPHVWFDLDLWSEGIAHLAAELGRAWPEHADAFAANAAAYRAELAALDARLRAAAATVPPEHRVLVTSHDAFSYWGRAYGFEVLGLQGVSTVAEVGLRDLSDLVDTLCARRVPAVFVESSVSPRAIRSVVEGCRRRGRELAVGGELYSDAMGDAGTPEGTFPGMVTHNMRTVVSALGGRWPEPPAVAGSASRESATP